MPGKLNKIINLIKNMGWRYISFRARYEVLKRSGFLKKKFPSAPPFKQYLTLDEWKQQTGKFFFTDKESLSLPRNPLPRIKDNFETLKNGRLLLFNSILTDLGKDYDWVTNPDSRFHYDVNKHWTQIADYSKEAGDIKFVWEKSRFSYLYDIIRHDYHFNTDCSELVFNDIISWIKCNPVNCGPNYRCSQEISLRVLNWTFALFYYRNSPLLTDTVFNQIQYAIYWQMHHVFTNINFSRIAVRNNHAITETLALYLTGIFYPSMPGATEWKKKGKAWFEQEIAYQVYEDGTFLQFSMNYHRIVVQLLTWGIALSEKNGDRFSDIVYDRAKKSVFFLRACMVEENGWLPNYGANDGALFFKLNDSHYRDYRPQLHALASVLGINSGFNNTEDISWYGLANSNKELLEPATGIHSFTKGGYYIIREPDTLTFIKCGSYKDRPSQADNLHLDIWYKGENLLCDAGSYKYNTDEATMRYFSGTESHNTVMIQNYDQMLKGGRFIWYYWTRCKATIIKEEQSKYIFTGEISAFRYINKKILHRRIVIKKKGVPVWEVKDEIFNTEKEVFQLWHIPAGLENKLSLKASDNEWDDLDPFISEGWQSSLYGLKEKTAEYRFTGLLGVVNTVISVEQASV